MLKLFKALILSVILTSNSYASETEVSLDVASLGGDVVSVYGKDCEKIKPGEARSTVRVRVTDKASYLAVSTLPDLKNAHIELNDHDFNVMVYNLVDNSIEDMAIRTTKQTAEEICVEVTGYITGKNIFSAIDEALNKQKNMQSDEDETAQEEVEIMTSNDKDGEKTTPLSEQEISQKEVLYVPDTQQTDNKQSEPTITPEQEEQNKYIEAKAASKGLIFVSPTEFFNNTTSDKYSDILREMFVKSDYFYVTDKKELADFVITPKVLRAKVDPINSETNRLQMVIAIEYVNADKEETETQHQNRFVLFNSSEDEQQVAANLMRQLFEKATDQIITELEIKQRKKNNEAGLPSVITPAPSSLLKPDAL